MLLHLKFVSHANLVTKTYCIRGGCHLGIAKACHCDIRLDAMEKRGLVAIITLDDFQTICVVPNDASSSLRYPNTKIYSRHCPIVEMEISNGLSIKHELHIFATIQGPLQFVSDSSGESTHLHIPSSGLAMTIKHTMLSQVSLQS